MVLVFARATLRGGHCKAGVVHDAIADVAWLHALVLLVQVLLPYLKRGQHGSVAVREHRLELREKGFVI